ncbi:TPA: sulfite exporter TauE/SafE family protein [Vibrio vulnificus]|nr:sulfite exporter TauE/SafE family protein [Vibrio vulnificus]HDY8059444.1 sulfite exporter TauE/SafE family protein [Vibrio vulnificus]HDY8078644.1 sulfite exporter TauE/SafE family protein [Vibrio vulnificus]HDY8189207.1 sulfite exporter TauE/SafE family protein [Vibrio vulnificus]
MDIILLFFAGVFGGMLNSIAGGGSFITFPALMAVGIPPVVANATNTFASCAGYISGAWGYRRELYAQKSILLKTIVCSLLGGMLGAFLLLNTSESDFLKAIPWLLLFATLLFVFGGRINQAIGHRAERPKHPIILWLPALFLVLVSAYGGFFNAGLGIVTLSYLTLSGHRDIITMNGLKLLISTSVSLIAVVIFIFNGSIDWWNGFVVMLGSVVGGYVSAVVARNLNKMWVHRFVTMTSFVITGYFFVKVYV